MAAVAVLAGVVELVVVVVVEVVVEPVVIDEAVTGSMGAVVATRGG